MLYAYKVLKIQNKEGSVERSRKLLFDAAGTGYELKPCRKKNKK